MRNFIQGCGAVFVVLGAITFAITVYTALVSASQSGSNGFGTFLAIMSGGAVFGAGITLVGGTAYLLASIDARLEEDAYSGVWRPRRPNPRLGSLPPKVKWTRGWLLTLGAVWFSGSTGGRDGCAPSNRWSFC